jgi:hypothetical protein
MDKVSCSELWRDWMIDYPQDSKVMDCKESISKFSKDDWVKMSEEATHLVQTLVNLVLNKTPLKDKTSEECFDLFIKHVDEWFFTVNKTFIIKLIHSCQTDEKFLHFFDRFHPGLTKHFMKLMMVYMYKLPD